MGKNDAQSMLISRGPGTGSYVAMAGSYETNGVQRPMRPLNLSW